MEDPSREVSGRRFTISVPREFAEEIRAKIMENDLFDPDRSIGRGEMIDFPILLPPKHDPDDILEIFRDLAENMEISDSAKGTVPRVHRLTPFKEIRERLSSKLDVNSLDLLPDKWDMIGDCLVLKLPEELENESKKIALVYQDVLGARFTLMDRTGIQGDLREPSFRTLTDPNDGNWEVTHIENSVKYTLDPRKVMFSSGNVDERMGIVDILVNGPKPTRIEKNGGKEVIIDMFAGIGYFTLPISLKCDFSKIYSIEKNPISFYYLHRNIRDNNVSGKVVAIHGDNRKVGPDEKADRIIMGYVGGTMDFIPRSLEFASEHGCIIHLHDTIKIEEGPLGYFNRVQRICIEQGYRSDLLAWRRVKSYAPRIDHIVLDIRIIPEVDVKV